MSHKKQTASKFTDYLRLWGYYLFYSIHFGVMQKEHFGNEIKGGNAD